QVVAVPREGNGAPRRIAHELAPSLGEDELVAAPSTALEPLLDELDGDRALLRMEHAGRGDEAAHRRDVPRRGTATEDDPRRARLARGAGASVISGHSGRSATSLERSCARSRPACACGSRLPAPRA